MQSITTKTTLVIDGECEVGMKDYVDIETYNNLASGVYRIADISEHSVELVDMYDNYLLVDIENIKNIETVI